MSTEERLLRLENAFATLAELASNQHERTSNLEEPFTTLVELARSIDKPLDQHQSWINQLGKEQAKLTAEQSNSESKIAALADAQIRTDEALAKLAEAQAHTDQRLDD